MILFPWFAAAHLLGIMLWVGGVASAAVLMALAGHVERNEELNAAIDLVFKRVAGSGLVLTYLAGIGLFSTRPGYYLHQGWFHAKLVLVLALTGFHMALRVQSKRAAMNPPERSPGSVPIFGAAAIASAIIILLLVLFQPF
jgi:protoporphyrinogen IX oxidase